MQKFQAMLKSAAMTGSFCVYSSYFAATCLLFLVVLSNGQMQMEHSVLTLSALWTRYSMLIPMDDSLLSSQSIIMLIHLANYVMLNLMLCLYT